MAGTPPNIVYIHSHDTGRYVQPYGHGIPTPNIQLLADQGVLFREAFCAAPTCSGSRASLLTGQYCHQNGMLGLAHRGWSLNDNGEHWIHALARGLSLVAHRRAAHRGRSGVDRLRRHLRRRLEPRRERRARGDRSDQQRARAVLPLGRVLRDAPELRRPHLGSRHALLPAARGPARHAADARGHGCVQGERSLARPGHRRGAQRAPSGGPRRPDPDRVHHRPRPGLSEREGDAF